MQHKSKSQRSVKSIDALLIDVFKHELFPVKVQPEWQEIAKMLDCQWIEAVKLATDPVHVIWVDEQGFLREPFTYPMFKCQGANGDRALAGYGLVTGIDSAGNTTDCTLAPITVAIHLWFENWGDRIPTNDVIPQMLRIY